MCNIKSVKYGSISNSFILFAINIQKPRFNRRYETSTDIIKSKSSITYVQHTHNSLRYVHNVHICLAYHHVYIVHNQSSQTCVNDVVFQMRMTSSSIPYERSIEYSDILWHHMTKSNISAYVIVNITILYTPVHYYTTSRSLTI